MKILDDARLIKEAQELYQVIQHRKQLDKREKELKDKFKLIFKEYKDSNLKIGQVLIGVLTKTRKGLDEVLLKAKFGEDEVKECEVVTEYQQVDVRLDDNHWFNVASDIVRGE